MNIIKTSIPLLFIIALIFYGCKKDNKIEPSNNSTTINSSKWMSSIAGETKLSQLSIPGTHDAGARFENFTSTAKCQSLTISEQLNAGVRFLDIRCCHINDGFAIYHGSVNQNLNFDDVLSSCINFLNTNPTESIIMSVKEEYNPSGDTRTFEETFDSYVQKNTTLWYLGSDIPKLDSVRGKIVLFRRFGANNTPKGLDASVWADNATFSTNNDIIKVQDEYVVSNDTTKWNSITYQLDEAKNGSIDALYLNFTSGYQSGKYGIPNINAVSDFINPKVEEYFNKSSKSRYGIVVMDFADLTRSSSIIKTNF